MEVRSFGSRPGVVAIAVAVTVFVACVSGGCGRSDLAGQLPGARAWAGDAGGLDAAADTAADAPADAGAEPTDTGGDAGGCDRPAAPERCGDGVDDDCDGVADEGCACDYAGQAAGVCANGSVSENDGTCLEPDLYEPTETRCDGRDNDCDGQVDETCTCVAGETQPCYNGPAGTETQGICQPGELTCQGNTFGGSCDGEVTPADETCNGADDNCDGVVDEGCPCVYADLDEGVCAQAVADAFGNCPAPADHQAEEVSCDSLDNDCDGVVDEGCACDFGASSAGVCAGGTVSATDGTCTEPADLEAEESTCDGKDNDCDGQTDEVCECDDGESRSCYDGPDGTAGVGICQAGQQACVDGSYGGTCTGQIGPEAEACDSLDNDCDGVVDEGCACAYAGESTGVCADGLIDASGTCTHPTGYQADETACDGLDNDCDATADEGCACDFTGTAAGVCSDGVLAADGTCTAPPAYQADETACDSLDNDCDGATDEGCPCDYRRAQSGVCTDAVRNDGGQCKPPRGFTGREAHCDDGVDNDCNGQVDCDDSHCAQRPNCR